MEGIDDKKLLPRTGLFGRHVRLVPGKHEIDFKSVHSSAFDTLVFVAEAGHSYQLRNHCLSLFSSDCHFWILDQTADLVVAGSFPEYLDRDLAARSVSAQTASDQARAFDERLARARCGQAEAQYDLAADYLAGFAPKGPDRVTAYAWLAAAARGGHEGAGKALRYLADRMTEAPPAPV